MSGGNSQPLARNWQMFAYGIATLVSLAITWSNFTNKVNAQESRQEKHEKVLDALVEQMDQDQDAILIINRDISEIRGDVANINVQQQSIAIEQSKQRDTLGEILYELKMIKRDAETERSDDAKRRERNRLTQ